MIIAQSWGTVGGSEWLLPSHGALLGGPSDYYPVMGHCWGVRVIIAQSWGTVGGASDYYPVMGHCWGVRVVIAQSWGTVGGSE